MVRCCSDSMSDPVVGSEKDRAMQVMFFRQHFGEFALGLASVDEAIKEHQGSIDHDEMSDKFFTINRGGLSMHPWADDRAYEDQVAIVGSGFIDNLDAKPCAYARYRCRAHEVDLYLIYMVTERITGLPSPARLAEDIMYQAGRVYSNAREIDEPKGDWWRWNFVDRARIPVKYLRLLDKVVARIDDSLGQGADFFQKPKSR
ncbi:hypothetical protein KW807_00785 [Candidatus Parcubacteria bacterium]|nr:hypothetical protein [Candidatus Parcubacteria bacterium]